MLFLEQIFFWFSKEVLEFIRHLRIWKVSVQERADLLLQSIPLWKQKWEQKVFVKSIFFYGSVYEKCVNPAQVTCSAVQRSRDFVYGCSNLETVHLSRVRHHYFLSSNVKAKHLKIFTSSQTISARLKWKLWLVFRIPNHGSRVVPENKTRICEFMFTKWGISKQCWKFQSFNVKRYSDYCHQSCKHWCVKQDWHSTKPNLLLKCEGEFLEHSEILLYS